MIVCRSGAGAVAEIAAAGKPSVLVPFPFAADDHQRRNAEAFERAGAARVVADREMTGEKLFALIAELANDSGANFNEDFDDSLDTIIHENTHNYQHKLVARLEAGEIRPTDPEYNQAVLFQLNFAGYLESTDEGHEAYAKQPVEMHAWLAGGEAHRLFLDDAKLRAATIVEKAKLVVTRFPAFATRARAIQRRARRRCRCRDYLPRLQHCGESVRGTARDVGARVRLEGGNRGPRHRHLGRHSAD